MDRNERLKRARQCVLYVTYKLKNRTAIGIVKGHSNMPNYEKVAIFIPSIGYETGYVRVDKIIKFEYK